MTAISITFVADAKNGKYAEEDTGTLVDFARDYNDNLVGIVLLTDNTFTTAPLSDFILDTESGKIPAQEK